MSLEWVLRMRRVSEHRLHTIVARIAFWHRHNWPCLLYRRVFPSKSINVFVDSNPSFANNLGEDAGSSYECQKCIKTKMILICKDDL